MAAETSPPPIWPAASIAPPIISKITGAQGVIETPGELRQLGSAIRRLRAQAQGWVGGLDLASEKGNRSPKQVGYKGFLPSDR